VLLSDGTDVKAVQAAAATTLFDAIRNQCCPFVLGEAFSEFMETMEASKALEVSEPVVFEVAKVAKVAKDDGENKAEPDAAEKVIMAAEEAAEVLKFEVDKSAVTGTYNAHARSDSVDPRFLQELWADKARRSDDDGEIKAEADAATVKVIKAAELGCHA